MPKRKEVQTMKRSTIALMATLLSLSPLTALAGTPGSDAQAAAGSDAQVAAAPQVGVTTVGMGKDSRGPGGRNITAFDRPGQRGVGGYFAQEFTANSDGKMFFDQRQMVLQVSSYLHENLFFNTEIEYEHGGKVEMGSTEQGGEISLEQAWGEYTVNDALNLRAGILLIPVGRLNVLHDADFREATTRPLMTRSIIPTTWYEPGVGARGTIMPSDTMEINYEAYVTQGLTDKIEAEEGLHEAKPFAGGDNNASKAVSGRVAFSPWLGTEIGLSGYGSAYDASGSSWLGMGALDFAWRMGAFELVGEGSLVSTKGGTFKETKGDKEVDVNIPTNFGGYYLEGHYSFFPEFLRESFLGKGLGFADPRFTAFARWGQADTDFASKGATLQSETVLGMNYRPVPNTALKVEWQHKFLPSNKATDAFISSLAMGF
jgi:hypothetical protein